MSESTIQTRCERTGPHGQWYGAGRIPVPSDSPLGVILGVSTIGKVTLHHSDGSVEVYEQVPED